MIVPQATNGSNGSEVVLAAPAEGDTEGLTLEQLAERINGEHGDCERTKAEARRMDRQSVIHARETGRLLKIAKARIGHGGWEPWVEREDTTSFGKSTAAKYIKLVDEWPRIEEQYPERVPDMTLREAFKLAYAKPDAEREEQDDQETQDAKPSRVVKTYWQALARCVRAVKVAEEMPDRLHSTLDVTRNRHEELRQALARLEGTIAEAGS